MGSFVKWVGGKGQILDEIRKRYPLGLSSGEITTYIEPFVGSGAVLWDILENCGGVQNVFIGDNNKELINCYNWIKEEVDKFIDALKEIYLLYMVLDYEERKKFFYDRRTEYNEMKMDWLNRVEIDTLRLATLFVFLNKTCYNGMYRLNTYGDFNGSWGTYDNPNVYDEVLLHKLCGLLKNVDIKYGDYKDLWINWVRERDYQKCFIYMDPPYRKVSMVSDTKYYGANYGDEWHKEMCRFVRKMGDMGFSILVSQSDPMVNGDSFFDDLYDGFVIERVEVNRMINGKVEGRTGHSELLIRNYSI